MKGGIDRGLCLEYSRLSYRRKFIRTLWIGAVGLPLLLTFQFTGRIPRVLGEFGVHEPEAVGWVILGSLLVLTGLQVWWTHRRWRAELQHSG